MKKAGIIFALSISLLSFTSGTSNSSSTASWPCPLCEQWAFDAVIDYYDGGGTDGFTAGLIFEGFYADCQTWVCWW